MCVEARDLRRRGAAGEKEAMARPLPGLGQYRPGKGVFAGCILTLVNKAILISFNLESYDKNLVGITGLGP